MLSEVGYFSLAMALGFAVFQFISPLWGGLRQDNRWHKLAIISARLQFFFVSAAFITLITAYVTCDFSLLNVFMNCHTHMPLLYRFAGAWGNHEGSMLLWVWILSLMGFAMTFLKSNPSLVRGAISIQGLMCVIFIAFLWWGADPFLTLPFTPHEGQSLNPLLQDRGLAIHPPMLYLGYVGFSAVFSFAIAGLWLKKLDKDWAVAVRPWALFSWACLTLGIALGSWWAYYELGWGGWWFWDPVENASLMPWLAGTALIHTLRVMEMKGQLRGWSVLLALLTFAFSLLGTFLVRSGLISSVHAFATDPHRGIIILAIIAFLVGGGFLLYALRLPRNSNSTPLQFMSREGAITINSLLLFAGLLTVTWGTLYPLMLEAISSKTVSVGAPYFNATVVPMLFPVLLLIPLGMELTWGQSSFKRALEKALHTFTPTMAIGVIILYFIDPQPVVSIIAASLALWLVVSSLYYGIRQGFMAQLPMILGHIGLGVTILGIAISTAWQQESNVTLTLGETTELQGYTFRLDDITQGNGPNYLYEKAQIAVLKNDQQVTLLMPEKRLYLPQESMQTETAIYTNGLINLYGVLGSHLGHKAWAIRLHYHPMVSWIWWGAALMALAAFLALRRRMRTI